MSACNAELHEVVWEEDEAREPPDAADEETAPQHDSGVVELRTPPYDLDAEAALLSAVMVDPDALGKVPFLRPEHFYSEAHRRMYEACTELAAAEQPVDVVQVATWLRNNDRLAQAGGMAYLTQVLNSAPAAAHVTAYGRTIHDQWRLRQLVVTCQRFAAQGYGTVGEVQTFIDAARAALDSIGGERTAETALRVWTPEEIWAPLPPPDYLVDGLLVRGSLALIVAYGSSFKTWLLEDAALAVATGELWLGRFPTRQGAALFVDFESGEFELRRRAHRIAAGRGFAVPVAGFAFVTMPPLSLAQDEFYAALLPLAEKYKLIGIDSLAAGSGGIDENDSRFAVSLQRLKAIAAETGCVIVLLHHSRKGAPGGTSDGDEREMVRGTSAIFNACDVVLQLVRSDDGAFTCRQTKARGGKAVEPFVVRVEDVGTAGTVVAASDVAATEEAAEAKAADKFNAVKARVVRLLAADKDIRSANEIFKRLKGTRKTVLDAVEELEERGTISKAEGVYRLASEVQP